MPLPGWVGHATHYAGAVALDTVYDPPLRVVEITGSGVLKVILDDDDETDAGAIATITVVAGTPLTYYAIREIKTTGSTGTAGQGYT